MVGGNASFSSIKSESNDSSNSSSNINLSPNIGYFFKDKFVFGFAPFLGYNKNQVGSNINYGFGAFTRYYFLKSEKIVNFLVGANYGYGLNSEDSGFANSYEFYAGPVVYFNSSVGLELLVKYQNYFSKFGNTPLVFNNVVLGLGFQIHLENNN